VASGYDRGNTTLMNDIGELLAVMLAILAAGIIF
jgi:hypothetical protein